MANPAGTDSPYEYVQLVATQDIDFSVTPYTVIWANNNTATTSGWAAGSSLTYGFNLVSGTVKRGDVFYVGGSGKLINGSVSADISGATWIKAINTGTTDGDQFGTAASTGVMGNGGSNADGIGVFNGTTVTSSSVPIDAIFFGAGVGTAYNSGTGAGYLVPANDIYAGNGLFGSTGNTTIFSDPGSGAFVKLTGTFNTDTKIWSTVRTSSSVSSPTALSAIATGITLTVNAAPQPTNNVINVPTGTTSNNAVAYSGTTATNAGTGSLIKTGGGTVVLTGVSQYTGNTLIQEGVVQVSQIDATGTPAAGPLGNGSAIWIGDVSTAGTLKYTGGTTTSARSVTINAGGGVIEVSPSSGSSTLTLGAVSGTGVLTKSGSGSLGLGAFSLTNGINILAGELTLNQTTSTVKVAGNSVLTGNLNVAGPIRLDVNAGAVISGSGKIQIQSSGTLISNSSGDQGGTISAEVSLNSTGISFTPGSWATTNYTPSANFVATIGATKGATTANLGQLVVGVISGNSDVDFSNNSSSGGGGGQLVLNGASTYTGNTTVNTAVANVPGAANIVLGVNNALPVGTGVIVGTKTGLGAAVLEMGGFNQRVAYLADGTNVSSANFLTVRNSSNSFSTLTLGGTSTAGTGFGGVIAGNIHLVKDGANYQKLSGSNTYAGATTVQRGTLASSTSGASPSTTEVNVESNGILQLTSKDGIYYFGSNNPVPAPVNLKGGQLTQEPGEDVTLVNDLYVTSASRILINNNANASNTESVTLNGALFGNAPLTLEASSQVPGEDDGRVIFAGTTNNTFSNTIGLGINMTARVQGNYPQATLQLNATNAKASGCGNLQRIQGNGIVSPRGIVPDQGILTAGQVDPSTGISFVFECTTNVPDWTNAADSKNDVLALTNATPFASALTSSNRVQVLLAVPSVSAGDTFQGGFFTPQDPLPQIQNGSLEVHWMGDGSVTNVFFGGKAYRSLDTNLTARVTSVATNGGYVTMVSIVSNSVTPAPYDATFSSWASEAGQPNLSMTSDTDGNGLTALLEYAYGAAVPGSISRDLLPASGTTNIGGTNLLVLTYFSRTSGVTVAPEMNTLIQSNGWGASGISNTLVGTVTTNNTTLELRRASVPIDNSNPRKFLRLKATAP